MKLLENLNFEVLIFGTEDFHFIDLSKGARESLLFTKEEIRELTPMEIFTGLSIESFSKLIFPLKLHKSEKVKLKTEVRRRNKSSFSAEVIFSMDKDEKYIIAEITNVSEKLSTENKLSSEILKGKILNDIVNSSPQIAFLWKNEEDWPVEFVSDNVDILGYSAEEFYTGKVKFADIVHKDDLKRVIDEVSYYTKTKASTFKQEYRVKKKNGQVIWVEDHTIIRYNDNGDVTHYQGFIFDITDTKEKEILLKEKEERLEKLIYTNPDWLIRCDLNGNILDFFTAKEETLQIPSYKFIGKNINDILRSRDTEALFDNLSKAYATQKMQTFNYNYSFLDYKFYVEIRLLPIENDEFVAIVRMINKERA